ncbi:anthranilate synthase component I family protein [soil metagenome]
MLNFGNRFNTFSFLDSHHYDFQKSFECLAAIGNIDQVISRPGTFTLPSINAFIQKHNDWIFGHLSYDLKNELEELTSTNPDKIGFPEMFFFVPEIVIILNEYEVKIGIISGNADEIYNQVISEKNFSPGGSYTMELKSRLDKNEYLKKVYILQDHIHKGDCYEINFCQEFYAQGVPISPMDVFIQLNNNSPNPFAAFYKLSDKFLLCASPERYLKRLGDIILSQPMKGTAARNIHDPVQDQLRKESLIKSTKERSENIMIVDLVRNDLSKVCEEGSVHVDEFLGLYSFPQVHQMISTIKGRVRRNASFSDIVAATFPMGSMTGAPKKKVMELIEKYETTRRGLFSGAIGYIQPGGDFDFNVVIRSIQYNSLKNYISVMVGSAITFESNAEDEYQECLEKLGAMQQALRNKN